MGFGGFKLPLGWARAQRTRVYGVSGTWALHKHAEELAEELAEDLAAGLGAAEDLAEQRPALEHMCGRRGDQLRVRRQACAE